MKKDKWSGQVDIGSGQVVFLSTCPTGQVDIKVNVEPCLSGALYAMVVVNMV